MRYAIGALPILVVAGLAHAVELRLEQTSVGRYFKVDGIIKIDGEYANPYDPCEVAVDLLIDGPDGRSFVHPAFFCQDYERRDRRREGRRIAWYYPVGTGTWRVRFAPLETGTYTLRARVRDADGMRVSAPVALASQASSSKGFLRPHPEDPRFLGFSDGTPFFAIGQNLAFIGEGQYVTLPKAEMLFGKLSGQGVNFLRIWTCCDDWAIAIEAPKSAWRRSWSKGSPIVSCPGNETRKCVKLAGADGTSIDVVPSHRVALRPNTDYVLAGRYRSDGPAGLRIQIGRQRWDVAEGESHSADWLSFRQRFTTGPDDYWLGAMSLSLLNSGTAWLDGLSLKEAGGSAELLWEADVNRPVRGTYNQLDCFMLDQLVDRAESSGIYLMLCLLTRNLYMDALSSVGSAEHRQAVTDAKNFMRYAVARWGYSPHVAAWEYFNEMDPGKPTDNFYEQMAAYLDRIDIYGHLRTTSTWHPSALDCKLAALDVAQLHHYLRPSEDDYKDAVAAVVAKAAFLREHAPAKPALIGEFGLADDKWGLSDAMRHDRGGVHLHNSLWASTFAGVAGTTMSWWWDELDRQDVYHHYRCLSAYLADVSFVGLQAATAVSTHKSLRILGYQGQACAYLWLFNRDATWWNIVIDGRTPASVEGATVEITGLADGPYTVTWWHTNDRRALTSMEASAAEGQLLLTVPAFERDIACKIRRR